MDMYAPPGGKLGLLPVALLLLAVGCSRPPGVHLEEVEGFGSNPGELRMFKYIPHSSMTDAQGSDRKSEAPSEEPPSKAGYPLVVLLHGCMQDAAEYGEDSGWVELAERRGFLLLLPQQQRSNYLTGCFNWYSPGDSRRGKGEALSIRQMIARMQRDYPVDPQRIYVTGVSAGGAMTLVMLATYPETFAGGAPIAGIAFGCADGLISALRCMSGPPDEDAAEWGAKVRAASEYEGPWPRLSLWQGEADSTVDPANATAIVRQWTNVQGIDSTPEKLDGPQDSVHSLYRDPSRHTLVESYLVEDMGHGVPVDPGPGERQCGKAGMFFPAVGICSSKYIARFWGLIP